MNPQLTRRQFFVGVTKALVGAAVATTVVKIPTALAECPRARAWELLNIADEINKKEGDAAAEQAIDDLLEHLNDSFVAVNDGRSVQEVRTIFRYPEQFTVETCSDTAFVVLIVRDGLKDRKLRLVHSPHWKQFAKKYTKVVMAA